MCVNLFTFCFLSNFRSREHLPELVCVCVCICVYALTLLFNALLICCFIFVFFAPISPCTFAFLFGFDSVIIYALYNRFVDWSAIYDCNLKLSLFLFGFIVAYCALFRRESALHSQT